MKKSNILIPLFALLLLSCSKDDDSPDSAPPTPSEINMSNLQVGQKSTYIRYQDVCGMGDGFSFTGDTLEVEVTVVGNQMYFTEKYTPGSTNLSATPVVNHKVTKHDGYVLIPERDISSLFFFYGNDTIWTNPQHDVNLSQDLCFVNYPDGNPFIGEEIGLINSFDIGAVSTGEATVVSCVPIMMDLDAYLIYDENELKISHSISPIWTSYSVNGFSIIHQ